MHGETSAVVNTLVLLSVLSITSPSARLLTPAEEVRLTELDARLATLAPKSGLLAAGVVMAALPAVPAVVVAFGGLILGGLASLFNPNALAYLFGSIFSALAVVPAVVWVAVVALEVAGLVLVGVGVAKNAERREALSKLHAERRALLAHPPVVPVIESLAPPLVSF